MKTMSDIESQDVDDTEIVLLGIAGVTVVITLLIEKVLPAFL